MGTNKLTTFLMRIMEFYKHSTFLNPGLYFVDKRFKCFAHSDEDSLSYAKKIVPQVSFCRGLRFVVPRIRKPDTGSVLVFSNSVMDDGRPQSVKIFDLSGGKVDTFYNDEEKFNADVKNLKLAEVGFPRPLMLAIDEDVLCASEELIPSENIKTFSPSEEVGLMSKVISCYSSLDLTATAQGLTFSKEDVKDLEAILGTSLAPADNCLAILQHGDLSFGNILYRKERDKVYFIDFEHADILFFMYDFFWMMQNSFIYGESAVLLDAFFAGDFDCELTKYFERFGLEYKKNTRRQYFDSFLIEMYLHRVRYLDERNKNVAIQSMKNLLNYALTLIRD